MRQPLYKTFGSIKLNPALKAAGWLAGYRRLARVLLRDALCAANDSNRHARPTCCSPAGPRLSPSCCGPSRFLSLLLDFSSRQRQPAGLPGAVRSLLAACCLLDRPNADQAQTMRTGLNTRPSQIRKTGCLATAQVESYKGRAMSWSGADAHRQPKVLLGQASRTCTNFPN